MLQGIKRSAFRFQAHGDLSGACMPRSVRLRCVKARSGGGTTSDMRIPALIPDSTWRGAAPSGVERPHSLLSRSKTSRISPRSRRPPWIPCRRGSTTARSLSAVVRWYAHRLLGTARTCARSGSRTGRRGKRSAGRATRPCQPCARRCSRRRLFSVSGASSGIQWLTPSRVSKRYGPPTHRPVFRAATGPNTASSVLQT